MIINFSAASFSAASLSAASSSTTPAAPAVNTNAPAAPVAPLTGASGNPAPASSGPSTPPAPAALSLFAQVMNQATAAGPGGAAANVLANVAPEADKAANDEHKADDKTGAVPADIAAALATQADNSLPAMAAPVIALPLPAPAETPAPAQAQAQAQPQTPSQVSMAQSNPALVLSMHPAAVTLNAAAAPAGRDTREPLAAANPLPSDKSGAPFDSYAAQGNARPVATPAAAAPVAAATAGASTARDGERAAEPVPSSTPSQGLTGAPATGAPAADTIKLNGPAQQWQAPLREALGDRLQTQVGRNGETAVIRLDPPMLGRIDIAIRHTAGSLQVSVTASNTEVLRQLQNIGDNLRSDLAQRQYTDVSVNISATPRSPAAQAFADNDARGQRQPGRQQDDNEPGRALSDDAPDSATFAMHEREQY
ncbi:flagellar hook-length control protein FliK [Janthinobacterium sp. Mn2066]|uniref:flagellar hook-length control protein FliK n=1 Tax=Janthinobacterium sp. Mn2066 TaxID=3395264 RepID=UPI003BDE4A64